MDVFLFQVMLLLYCGGTFAYLIYLISPRGIAALVGRWLLGFGASCHAVAFALRYIKVGHPPFVNLHEALSFFALLIVVSYLLFWLKYRDKGEVLGGVVSPLALLLVIWAAALPKNIMPLPPVLRSWWLPVHAFFAFLGDAIFAIAFCAGVIYLIQERLVKSKSVVIISARLPSLALLDEINYRALTIGFPLLTIGIVTGAVWAEYAWGSYWSWDPKETWSLITWLLYAALLHQRLMKGWRGKKAAVMSILGFGCVLFTFLGVNLVLGGLHSYSVWYR